MVLDNSFGRGTLTNEGIKFSGNAKETKGKIKCLSDKWIEKINNLSNDEFISNELIKWPFKENASHEFEKVL